MHFYSAYILIFLNPPTLSSDIKTEASASDVHTILTQNAHFKKKTTDSSIFLDKLTYMLA